MKRLFVLSLALFTFLVAPSIPGLRTCQAAPKPAMITPKDPTDVSILDLFMEKEEPAPVVTCQSDPATSSDRCVPKYRFNDEVDAHTSKKAVKWIEAANAAGADEILFEINTPGGEIDSGWEIMKAIEDSKAPVTCVVDGNAESMGFMILQSCQTRMMTPRSKLMAHEPGLGGMFFGRPNEWQAVSDMMAATRAQVEEQCQHRLTISMEEYQKHTRGGQMWFILKDEALKIHAIDATTPTVKKQLDKMLHPAKGKLCSGAKKDGTKIEKKDVEIDPLSELGL